MQEAHDMKKILGLLLAFCLVFILAMDAYAAGKPSFTKQPVTSTTNKKGTVSFSVKISGSIKSLTWYFIDPATGNSYTGKQLAKAVKGVKVTGPNSKKITLKKVPDSMHGWTVYCHVNGNGYKVDSEHVQLLVYGLEPPAQGPVGADTKADAEKPEAKTEPDKKDDSNKSDETKKTETNEKAGDSSAETNADEESNMTNLPDNIFTVSCSSKLLRKLDSAGKIVEGEPSSSLEFTNTGSFIVSSEEPIKSWTINGVRFEPSEPIKEFRIMNVTGATALDVKIIRATAASLQVDTSHMCQVTCNGCTFTYLRGGLRSVTSGQVPAGAAINVVADSSDLAAAGYRINGAEPVKLGMASFQYIVTDNVEISTK